jgi:acyl carrier protein
MASRTKILDMVLKAVQSLNEERPKNEQLNLSEATLLFGEGSQLDSLSLVSLIVDIETAVMDEWDESISLTDDRAMDRDSSPFTDVRALTDYIFELLLETKGSA